MKILGNYLEDVQKLYKYFIDQFRDVDNRIHFLDSRHSNLVKFEETLCQKLSPNYCLIGYSGWFQARYSDTDSSVWHTDSCGKNSLNLMTTYPTTTQFLRKRNNHYVKMTNAEWSKLLAKCSYSYEKVESYFNNCIENNIYYVSRPNIGDVILVDPLFVHRGDLNVVNKPRLVIRFEVRKT